QQGEADDAAEHEIGEGRQRYIVGPEARIETAVVVVSHQREIAAVRLARSASGNDLTVGLSSRSSESIRIATAQVGDHDALVTERGVEAAVVVVADQEGIFCGR